MQRFLFVISLLWLSGCVAIQSPTVQPTEVVNPTTTVILPATPTPTDQSQSAPIPIDIFTANQRLRHTVNLGNALEAPVEGEWGVYLREDYFRLIAKAGFTAVRVPINFEAHADKTAPYAIDPYFLERVDWVIQNASANGLVAILDMHNYQAMMDTPYSEQQRFMALWGQIADRYWSYPNDQVYFELLNEPFGNLDNAAWNVISDQTLTVIRLSNPLRPVILGPSYWNSFDQVPNLQLPDDAYLIVTFHYYLPFQFTHQGAEWVDGSNAWMGTTWGGSASQVTAINNDFNSVQVWAKSHHRPVFLGEFGAYSKGDQASRDRWTSAVARAAEAHGFSWGYWEFCAGFGVFDPTTYQWRPDLLQALISNP
jgi:endoglucanase